MEKYYFLGYITKIVDYENLKKCVKFYQYRTFNMTSKMKFEKFYLIDYRGTNNKIILKFVHIGNGKEIKGNTSFIAKILQTGEIQVQTKFATKKFTNSYAKHKFRNLRQMKPGSPVNIYYLPVILSDNKSQYIMQFYQQLKDK